MLAVAELASAWGTLAPRLPPKSSVDSTQDADGVETAMLIEALKLALSSLQGAPVRRDGREPMARTVELAAVLADLATAGIPLDAESIAAGVLLEAADTGRLGIAAIQARLGPGVADLVHDVQRIRSAPERVELFDDVASSAVREWCLALHDVRAVVLQVVDVWDSLRHMGPLPAAEQQLLALEALQLVAPLGHALGLGVLSAAIEDACFRVLFPSSYDHTSAWLRELVDAAEGTLFACQRQLLSALDEHPRFKQLAGSCVIRARTKSLFSIMKKLLRLEDLSKGGRSRDEVYDVLGMRAVVSPRPDLPVAEAEALAAEACYVVREVAELLWSPVPDRSKDYIAAPKSNGYQSLHLTIELPRPRQPWAAGGGGGSGSGDGDEAALLEAGAFAELQVRTAVMDEAAEGGDSAHSLYKGGLDAAQARQLRDWTSSLRARLPGRATQLRLQLPAGGPSSSASSSAAAAAAAASSGSSGSNGDGGGVGGVSIGGVAVGSSSLFAHWDLDGNGVLTLGELREQLQQLGGGESDDDARALMALLTSTLEVDESTADEPGGAPWFPPDDERTVTLAEFDRFVRRVTEMRGEPPRGL
ncbi:hypothetical protein FOA52_002143 [Chlamydomonas sp. UWO 241]|nr:hypothetical protein FOA52_002143 [Chlamydomonas sp. UWO 241]